LTSPTGAAEFAKKFRLDHLTTDVSPVSVRKIFETRKSPLGWYNYVSTTPRSLRLSTLLRIAVFGFKAASRPLVSSKHGLRARRHLVMLMYARCQNTELALTLAVGAWIPPQVFGRIISFMVDYYRPKDLVPPPQEALFDPDNHGYILEVTLYQGWMRQYLKYLHWYSLLLINPRPDEILSAPVYIRTWYSTFRFGIMFRLYDISTTRSILYFTGMSRDLRLYLYIKA